MNILLDVVQTSLEELKDGLAGKLNMTDAMETLATSININAQPAYWVTVAYPSQKNLADWYTDLLRRH